MVRPVHDRISAILHLEDYGVRIGDDARKRDLLTELLRPYPASGMTAHPANTAVSSPRSQDELLIEQVLLNSA